MQFLKISSKTTLSELSDTVGSQNVDNVLATNGLTRSPNIGEQFIAQCEDVTSSATDVTNTQKKRLLNTLTGDSELFEEACNLSESGWKVLQNKSTFPQTLKMPDTVTLKDSADVLGGKASGGVSDLVYRYAINKLNSSETSPSLSQSPYSSITGGLQGDSSQPAGATDMFNAFNLPWGKIQLYSSLADTTIDFPVYPEEMSDGKSANYTTMPDIIYQYEPWQVYESSGPREISYTFDFHRDMWSGNHLDGKANELIRFCEANCYPKYSGSEVHTATVKMYINGSMHISGIMTKVDTDWDGPIGLDGWYLHCKLTLSITEVAESARDFSTIQGLSLIGE